MSSNEFQQLVFTFYKKNKRSFPWRETSVPYEIMVSELMLQQTQTLRVVPKFIDWLAQFPNENTLANAPLAQVLTAWSGLGYNRRAKFLWLAAKAIAEKGTFPKTHEELIALPGIGIYTASAILAFAYNKRALLIETNIRTVMIHHYFRTAEQVSDKEILEVLDTVTPATGIRDWFYALMDYGSFLKSSGISYTSKQKGYTKQSKFDGSDRFVRGYILKQLSAGKRLQQKDIVLPGYTLARIQKIVKLLTEEKLVSVRKGEIIFPEADSVLG